MNQFVEIIQFMTLAPISIGLDSADIEQEILYLTEEDIERHRDSEVKALTYRRTNPPSLLGACAEYDTVNIKPGVKVWGRIAPNGSVYLLNSNNGQDFFVSICAEEVCDKLLSIPSA